MINNQVNEYTPLVYYLASLSDGNIAIEDETPGLISSWRRLRDYCTNNGCFITKLRIQTPHQLINCDGNNYTHLYRMNKVLFAPHNPDRVDLNGSIRIYGTSIDNINIDVYTIFSTENYKHVGFHKATFKHLNNSNLNIDINDIGMLINTNARK